MNDVELPLAQRHILTDLLKPVQKPKQLNTEL